ncbi:MAG: type III-A CRISPR-associated RAMP protein Csm4 [Syntrophomonadaceae bacterium]|nr:type III-A CRISPR-associated RAMP protein Csm4 [Syntrophomonadaceae bacterium]
MEYSLYKLNFTTALHMGKHSGGASLDDGQMTIHADTLFSALCCEAARVGQIDQLVKYFADGTLTISDALPYAEEELFLPKPILFVGNKKREGDASLKKKLKSLEFIPLSSFREYLKGLNQPEVNLDKLSGIFGHLTTITRVAIKGNNPPLPYHVAAWKFASGCGLYIIVRFEQDEALDTFETLLANLGLSGIGGKQSSGLGKFKVQQSPVPAELIELIEEEPAEYQMLLGTALPVDAELDKILQNGWYTVVRRGGFIRSENYAPGQLKKRSIYMLAPGSCLPSRFKGGMYDLSDNGGAHPVWRCGRTLFAGVNL